MAKVIQTLIRAGYGKISTLPIPVMVLAGETFTSNGMLNENGTFGSLPAWLSVNTLSAVVTANLSAVANGNYAYQYTISNGINSRECLIVFEISDCYSTIDECFVPDCQDIFSGCSSKLNHVVWLNNKGGYESYIFGGVAYTETIQDGDAVEFYDISHNRSNVFIGKIRKRLTFTTGIIPESHLPILASLRSSVAVWLFDENAPYYVAWNDRFKPVLVEREAVVTTDTIEDIIERSVSFYLSEEIETQTS